MENEKKEERRFNWKNAFTVAGATVAVASLGFFLGRSTKPTTFIGIIERERKVQ